MTICLGCGSQADAPPVGDSTLQYEFSEDWFSPHIPVWERVFAERKGKPGLSYLEIGTFEGKSFFWMLDNVLTHPTSRATGIDLFPIDMRPRFDHNLAASGHADRVTVIAGSSQEALRQLPLNSFDIIYVDGSHAAKDVLADAVLSWPLLASNGLLILDDYDWRTEWPLEFRPKVAIDAFLTVYRNDLEIVDDSDQIIIRKLEMPMPYVLRMGRHAYFWRQRQLFRIGEQTPRTPDDSELYAIERLAASRGFGEVDYLSTPELEADDAVQALLERLGLELTPVDE